jgi:hypothetical protein
VKVKRHSLALFVCALIAGCFAALWDWLHPIIRPAFEDRMGDGDFQADEFYDLDLLRQLFLSWLIVFC